jgi:hypothetical protein
MLCGGGFAMKHGWVVLLLLAGVMAPGAARAQVAFYGEFSVSDFASNTGTSYLPGVTAGFMYDGAKIYNRVTVAADLQGRFVRVKGQSLNGITIGPRFEIPLRRGFSPYGELMVGFARYDSNTTGASSDATLQVNAGLAKQFSPHLDGVVEYSYAQYYGLSGAYNPKTFSIGAIYHLTKR